MDDKVFFANSRGERLAGVLHVPQQGISRCGVVLCHGMESSKSSWKLLTMSQFFQDRGLTALRFDFANDGCFRSDDRSLLLGLVKA